MSTPKVKNWTEWFSDPAFPGYEFKKVTQIPQGRVEWNGKNYVIRYKMAYEQMRGHEQEYVIAAGDKEMYEDWFVMKKLVVNQTCEVLLRRNKHDVHKVNKWVEARPLFKKPVVKKDLNGLVEF